MFDDEPYFFLSIFFPYLYIAKKIWWNLGAANKFNNTTFLNNVTLRSCVNLDVGNDLL